MTRNNREKLMLVSIKHKFAFLAMSKTGSTSIELALGQYADIAFIGNPKVKHISCRRYGKFIAPYIRDLGYTDIETVCLFREPISWLFSWYRYRQRPAILGKPRSTANITFDEFVTIYMTQDKGGIDIGRPMRFVTDQQNNIAIDHIYKYENIDGFKSFMEQRIGEEVHFDNVNVSPQNTFDLDPEKEAKLKDFFAPEYEIYENAIG